MNLLTHSWLDATEGERGRMQRFFFNIRTEEGFVEDDEGELLPSLCQAITEAMHIAREYLCEQLRCGHALNLSGAVYVRRR